MSQMAEARITLLPKQATESSTLSTEEFTIRFTDTRASVRVRVVAGPTDLNTGETAKVILENVSPEANHRLYAPADCDIVDAAGNILGRGRVTRVWSDDQ